MFRKSSRQVGVAPPMRWIMGWRGTLLAAAMVLGVLSGDVRAQDYAPPDSQLPLPLYNTRPEDGGFFLGGSFVMYRWTNPLDSQPVAVRGLLDMDGSISSAVTGSPSNPTFFGSRRVALDVHQVSGPNGHQPGFSIEGGWKFYDGSALTLRWMYLNERRNTAVATFVPADFDLGPGLQDSFLTAFVFNFHPEYAGPPDDVGVGNPFAAYGIWNAATHMTLEFIQRFQEWDMTYRQPIIESECYRLSGTIGPRFSWIWERFKWVTTATQVDGTTDPLWVGIYTNIISNRMYGLHAGCCQEWYLGHGFAATLDLEGALFFNIVKTRAKYELGDKFRPPQRKRSNTEYTIVPEVRATLGLMWYPSEGIQVKIGYDVMAFFNTIVSPEPIDFNWGAVDPDFRRGAARLYDGVQAAIIFNF